MLTTLIITFLLLSALFSGTEIAFISASKLIVELKKKKGTRSGKIIAGFFEKLKEEVGDRPDFLTHLASHPDLSGRAQKAEAADRIGDQTFMPALNDQDWVALQEICG